MKNISHVVTLGALVSELPEAARYFNQKKIDYCCGGQRSLQQAAQEAGTDLNELMADLEALNQKNLNNQTKKEAELASDALADQIEAKHHRYMRENLPIISELMDVVMQAHGVNHPELFKLHSAYSGLRGEIEQHLVKEEILLFPHYHQHQHANHTKKTKQLDNIIGELRQEHENAGAALKRMRQITHDYQLPDDACTTFELLYNKLKALEEDLFQHIHLENNILFNREVSE